MQGKRLNVLVGAFAFAPGHGSEAGVGWNIATRLAKHHNVTVLYGDDVAVRDPQNCVESRLNEHPVEGLQAVYVPCRGSWWARFLKWLYETTGFTPFWFVYYYRFCREWQWSAYKKGLALHSETPFDLAHQLTYITYREPGFLWKLPIPFFWGPINGADNIPWAYFGILTPEDRATYLARNLVNLYQRCGRGRIGKVAKHAAKIWVVTDADKQMVSGKWGLNADQQPEVGIITSIEIPNVRSYNGARPLSLVWSGRMEGRKALPLLINALSMLTNRDRIRLTVLGDGPEWERSKQAAVSVGINHLIDWKGRLPLHEARKVMDEADVFVLTSIKEASATVCMEALVGGLPVVCHDACGMANVIDGSCGIKVPMKDPETSVQGFFEAIQRFLDEPGLIAQLSEGALSRAEMFSWDKKVERIANSYS
jgi:glycosyltransferase involved in cell wall biosynthesis